MSLTDDIDNVDIYSKEIEDMDSAVTTVVALELVAGIMVTPNLAIIFSYGLPYVLQPYSLFMILVNYVYTSTLIVLVLASIYLAWTLWNIKPRARFDAIIVNTISIVAHLPSLSPVIVLNLIIIYFLNTRRMRDVYMKLPLDEVSSN